MPKKLFPKHLFLLYNPWGTDFPQNKWNDSNPHFNNENIKKQIDFKNNENDGFFYLSMSDIIKNFEKIISIHVDFTYEPISLQVPLPPGPKNLIQISFKPKPFATTFVYCDIIDKKIKNQIQPYSISNFSVVPFTSINQGEFMIYKGFSSVFLLTIFQSTVTMRFNVEKFNEDIDDKIFVTFYAKKNSLKITSKMEEFEGCYNNCNKKGKCINNICQCDKNVMYLISFFY